MMKKIALVVLYSISLSAADNLLESRTNKLTTQIAQLEQPLKKEFSIKPSDFNEIGKKILQLGIDVWVLAAHEAHVPTDTGLAKIWVDMKQDGIEKIINDEAVLKKTNEYATAFEQSPTMTAVLLVKKMCPNKDGDYSFPGAKQVVTDTTRILRQNEYYNIMYKRHETPIMPENQLVGSYYNLGTESAKEVLKLNITNSALSRDAIRGIALLNVYYIQQDLTN